MGDISSKTLNCLIQHAMDMQLIFSRKCFMRKKFSGCDMMPLQILIYLARNLQVEVGLTKPKLMKNYLKSKAFRASK